MNTAPLTGRDEQRRRARRTALLFGLLALAVYAGFICMSVYRSHG